MMKKYGVILIVVLSFALLAARPSVLCADEGGLGSTVPGVMKINSANRLHPIQTMTGNVFARIYKSPDMNECIPPLSGVWQTGAGLYRLLLPGLTTTMEWGYNLQWTAQPKPVSGIDFTKESLLKPDRPVEFAGLNQISDVAADQNRPVLANLRHQDIYDGLISLSYPITATRSLTITPIISYSFAVNGGNRQELRNRGIKAASDTIVYSGIHAIFTF